MATSSASSHVLWRLSKQNILQVFLDDFSSIRMGPAETSRAESCSSSCPCSCSRSSRTSQVTPIAPPSPSASSFVLYVSRHLALDGGPRVVLAVQLTQLCTEPSQLAVSLRQLVSCKPVAVHGATFFKHISAKVLAIRIFFFAQWRHKMLSPCLTAISTACPWPVTRFERSQMPCTL